VHNTSRSIFIIWSTPPIMNTRFKITRCHNFMRNYFKQSSNVRLSFNCIPVLLWNMSSSIQNFLSNKNNATQTVGMNMLTVYINFISLYCFLSVQYLNYISVFQLIALNIFYKQHIKTYVSSKTLKISPTCFGHLATILREIQYLSLLQLLNYRCSSMPAGMLLHL
jgi:uncharacterized membrane protein YGL010W